jgi:hypothetical protein
MSRNIGLGKYEPYLAWGGKIRPSEIDELRQFVYLKPSANDSAIMNSCALGSKTSATGTITSAYPDYPRSLLVSFKETGGTVFKGTVTVTGKNQFGEPVSEGFGCVSLGTTGVAGSRVFNEVTAVSAVVGSFGTGAVDARIGFAIGTPSAKLGLFTKVGAVNNVRKVVWVDNATIKTGTVTVDTANHAIAPADAIDAQDDYLVWVAPDYKSDDQPIGNMGTSAYVG